MDKSVKYNIRAPRDFLQIESAEFYLCVESERVWYFETVYHASQNTDFDFGQDLGARFVAKGQTISSCFSDNQIISISIPALELDVPYRRVIPRVTIESYIDNGSGLKEFLSGDEQFLKVINRETSAQDSGHINHRESESDELSPFAILYNQHIAHSLFKLRNFHEFLNSRGEWNWHLNMNSGRIDLDHGRDLPCQILGTWSKETETWLWAWANEQSKIPTHQLKASLELKQLGLEQDVFQFSKASLDCSREQAESIAQVAAGVCNASSYYLFDVGKAIMFILLFDVELNQNPTLKTEQIFGVINQVIMQGTVRTEQHRYFISSFLRQLGLNVSESRESLCARTESGQLLSFIFNPEKGDRLESYDFLSA